MYHQVLQMLADGQRYTAQGLVQRLAITPSALQQAIHILTDYGLQLYHPITQSYQWTDAPELLDKSCIWKALSNHSRQQLERLDVFTVIDSTNCYALAQSYGIAACLAEYQTAGRGRQGRQWISPYASGLCLSLKYRYPHLFTSLGGLNIALAVTIAQVLRRIGAESVRLKWPNDIMWQGCKLAGLLLETRAQQHRDIVIGIGINVKVPSPYNEAISQPWVDLYTVLGQTVSRNALAAQLIDDCLQTLLIYPYTGLQAFMPAWQALDMANNQLITIQLPGERVTGRACGIDDQGALRVQTTQGIQHYACGEVTVRL